MANASSTTTIRPDEAAHFGQLAADWWDPKGSSAMLHRLNPVRLAFLRDAIDAHWAADSRGVRPLAGKRALDVGCGAGLLCEPGLMRLKKTLPSPRLTHRERVWESIIAAAMSADWVSANSIWSPRWK
jgi:2-polyprenyl-3-methyl-5-hydroxy-6-metoxy-1,4-benzoquinol methylase